MTIKFKSADQRVTIRQNIQKELREAILKGELAPGSKLVESHLATQFGTSRAPVREAISALVEESFVISIPYEGYFVLKFNAKDLKDLFEMRMGLECLAFELIWPKRTSEFYEELDRRNEVLKKIILSKDQPEAIKAELDLHATVYEFVDNNLLFSAWKKLSGRSQMFWVLHQNFIHHKGATYTGHDRYIKFAKGEHLEEMYNEISEHIKRGMRSVSSLIVQMDKDC